MTERQTLLESIAATTADYRAGDLPAPNADHVDRWIKQFDAAVQLPMLRELDHVFKKTYLSKKKIDEYLAGAFGTKKLAGSNPCDFWKRANFLRNQQNGNSQEELLALLDDILESKCGFKTGVCGAPGGDFIYLDDAIFSGSRVGNDLERWIVESAPERAAVHVIVLAIHTLAEYQVGRRLRSVSDAQRKEISIKFWHAIVLENRKASRKDSQVLWPAQLPDEESVRTYMALPHKFPFEVRPLGGNAEQFSSEQGRSLLERELLLAGLKIRGHCETPKNILRPLGFSPFGLGFGSMIVTYRNCPNNSPLALWWGDPCASRSSPLSKWYPLFARKTYQKPIVFEVGVFYDLDIEDFSSYSSEDYGF